MQELAEEWGLQFMPTFMLFKNGKKVVFRYLHVMVAAYHSSLYVWCEAVMVVMSGSRIRLLAIVLPRNDFGQVVHTHTCSFMCLQRAVMIDDPRQDG